MEAEVWVSPSALPLTDFTPETSSTHKTHPVRALQLSLQTMSGFMNERLSIYKQVIAVSEHFGKGERLYNFSQSSVFNLPVLYRRFVCLNL